MGRTDRFTNMNEVHVRMETANKEQPTIRLQHMNGGPNGCCCQPRLQFAEVEGKGIHNLKNLWIGCWLLKRFLSSMGYPMNDESLWWYTHSGEELLRGGNN
jgi:hypothetical protein